MTNPQTITQLIEDLQAAEVGTRELDARICALLRIGKKPLPLWLSNWEGEITAIKSRCFAMHIDGTRGANWEPSLVTASIDAAMTTIPEGWELIRIGSVTVMTKGDDGYVSHLEYEPFIMSRKPLKKSSARHKSIPLAICIASLYAILKELETT